jgi:hypothetical protein
MRTPHRPDGTRFFARVIAAILECPRCGTVQGFGPGLKIRQARWDSRSSSLRCSDCGISVTIGMLAWPRLTGGADPKTRPRDQVPNERQLAQLRALASGIWMGPEHAKRRHRPDDTNITALCTCKPGTEYTEQRDHNCPLHADPYVVAPFVDDEGDPL